jgi:hypothetical protein
MSIKSSKFVYLNFSDINNTIVNRDLKMLSIYKTTPILNRCSDYLVSVSGFNLPLDSVPNKTQVKQINVKTNSIPVKQTFLNTPNAIQPMILYSYFPSETELKGDNIVYNTTEPLYHTLDYNEQLINIDLYVELVYNNGTQILQISPTSIGLISLQFKYIGLYNDI